VNLGRLVDARKEPESRILCEAKLELTSNAKSISNVNRSDKVNTFLG